MFKKIKLLKKSFPRKQKSVLINWISAFAGMTDSGWRFSRGFKMAVLFIGVLLVASCGFKNRKGYLYDNHRYNYVRLEKFKDRGNRSINHPYNFSEADIGTILRMIEIKKGAAFSDDDKEKKVFNQNALAKMTVPIVKAFQAATPEQKVGFSFLVKDPTFIIRNDRLSRGSMWVEDNKLHIRFDDLYVKLTGDINKRGIYEVRQAQNAKGLRVSLETLPGQEYGDSAKELVIDIRTTAKITEERLKKEKELAEKGVDETVKIKVVKDKTVKDRIKELDALRKERMITEEEYQQKKKELLKQL